MNRFQGPKNFSHGDTPTLGVLLLNLGTPDAPTPGAVRRYLAEFLWDRRIVEIPRPLWWLILHGIILRTRPSPVSRNYAGIWEEEGSPLLAISKRQAKALQQSLEGEFSGPVKVALGMRYGNPSVKSALEELQEAGARQVLVLPLYPQYSGTTTASTFDAIADVMRSWRWMPELRFINHYHDNTDYIAALAASVEEHWAEHGRAERLLMSFHGVPKRVLLAGDPYFCECQKTARLVAEHLKLEEGQWQITFQSRFGKEEWLKPYTSETLKTWGEEKLASVDVICPGFSADCLETLEEIQEENREIFQEAGGGAFRYIAALNERDDHIDMMVNLVKQHSRGWPQSSDQNWSDIQQGIENTAQLAKKLGCES